MLSIIGALTSAFGFASANIVAKKSLTNISTTKTLFTATISGVFFLSILTIASGVETLQLETITYALFLAGAEVSLYLALYKAFSVANVSVASSVISIYPIGSLVFSVLFLGEIIVPLEVIFIFTIISGAILTSVRWDEVKKDGFDRGDLVKGFGWIMITTLVHVLYFPLLGEFTSTGVWEYRLLLIKAFSSLILFLVFRLISRREITVSRKQLPPLILLGLFEVIGWIGYSWAGTVENALAQPIIIALQSSTPLMTAIGAYFFLREKLTKLQYLGIVVIVASLIGLA